MRCSNSGDATANARSALVLANTRAGAETPEGRATRLQIADKVEREGTSAFIDDLLQKLFSKTT